MASKIAIRCRSCGEDVADHPTGDAREADRVPLAGAVGGPARPAIRRAYSILVTSPRAVFHRSAGIEHQAAAEIGVGLKLLDVKPVGPAVGPPVEPTEVVAGNVFTVFRELDARPAMWTGMPSRDVPLHGPARRTAGKAASRDKRRTHQESCRRERSGIIGAERPPVDPAEANVGLGRAEAVPSSRNVGGARFRSTLHLRIRSPCRSLRSSVGRSRGRRSPRPGRRRW